MRFAFLAVFVVACSTSQRMPGNDADTPLDGSNADGSADGAVETVMLRLGLTVHLEEGGAGWQFSDDQSYETYTKQLRSYGRAFAEHGAKLTLEPRDQLVAQVAMRNDSIFDDLSKLGHSFGSHAAIGTESDLSYEAFVGALTDRHKSLERVAEPVEHVSGNCSELDWVSAVADAGFLFTTGTTVYCLLSLPASARPAGYEDLECASAVGECHLAYPSATVDRVHPWRALDGSSWLTHNANGPIVIIPGGGTLPCLEEEAAGGSGPCTLTDGDVELSLEDLDQAIFELDAKQVNTFYFVWSFGTDLEAGALESWLSAVDERVAAGTVTWNTGNEMYAAFVEWEKAQTK